MDAADIAPIAARRKLGHTRLQTRSFAMLRSALLLPILLCSAPAFAADITCEGAFGVDTSEARLKEVYGAENVVTGDVDGPEGTTMLATEVFPDDPQKRMMFVWWNEETLTDVSYVELPPGDSVAGVKLGMTVKEVEAINGEPFSMTGFWWDYGGFAGFQSGTLAELPGGCMIQLSFNPGVSDYPASLDVEPVSGDRQVDSTEPLLETLDVRVDSISLGYAHPDFRNGVEPSDGEETTEDTRG
jgi:hypothetical protein